jgi:nicotinate phosphoribosyltransferase
MSLKSLLLTDSKLGICTDLYEITMAAAYFSSGRKDEIATFELFTRELPPRRSFLVAAGLEQAIHHILNTRFPPEVIEYLKTLKVFRNVVPEFWEYLADFRFSGEILALPEGTLFFENEPIVQVRAPIVEAQILETLLINGINFQTLVASKAVRMCLAAKGREVVDFGSRRAHGPQTSVLAARAAYIGGCAGTSNVLAGLELGIPVYGTMAHSWVQFFEDEKEAYSRFQQVFPESSVFLIDTYDTLQGLDIVIDLEKPFLGVRLDSGDLADLAPIVRNKLDQAGHPHAMIMASGNLNEDKLLLFQLEGLPIDAYGVGTDLVVSGDHPTCDLVYKLVEVEKDGQRIPKLKKSVDKTTIPFRKKIMRRIDHQHFTHDLLIDWEDQLPEQEHIPLLQPILRDGLLIRELPSVEESRKLLSEQLSRLPRQFLYLHSSERYPVRLAGRLAEASTDSDF